MIDLREIYNYYKELRDRELAFGMKVNEYCQEVEDSGFKYVLSFMYEDEYSFKLIGWPSDLEELIVPDCITEIDNNTTDLNTHLKRVVLGKNCAVIGCNSFSNCIALREIVGGDSLRLIDRQAFLNCKELSDFHFGKNLEVLASRAFAHTGLTHVKFNSRLITLKPSCFAYCENLKEVEDLWCVKKENVNGSFGVFKGCVNLEKVSIIDISSIPKEFFWYCSSLKSVDMQCSRDSLARIEEDAFYKCNKDLLVRCADGVV